MYRNSANDTANNTGKIAGRGCLSNAQWNDSPNKDTHKCDNEAEKIGCTCTSSECNGASNNAAGIAAFVALAVAALVY